MRHNNIVIALVVLLVALIVPLVALIVLLVAPVVRLAALVDLPVALEDHHTGGDHCVVGASVGSCRKPHGDASGVAGEIGVALGAGGGPRAAPRRDAPVTVDL